jgi:hypothetical protein
MNDKLLDKIFMEASRRNLPVLVRENQSVALGWSKPPRPQASFGMIDGWVEIGKIPAGADVRLLIPFQPNQLGWVRLETLQLFRYDLQKKSFEKVDNAQLEPQYAVMHARVNTPGVYGLIGLHSHPLVQETIRLLCEMRPAWRGLPQNERRAVQDRICNLVLCARDMDKFWESRDELIRLAENLGVEIPGREVSGVLPPALSRLAQPGESICDRCNGIDLDEFLDCELLEPMPPRPCRQAAWENVGPKHISGAMRQILVDPADHQRLYAVAANGGIWRLDNVDNYPDEIWHPLTDTDDVNNLRFRTMAVAPSNGYVLYAANSVKELLGDPVRSYSEIYRSGNRGRSWERVDRADMGVVHRIVVHPANANVVFAATSNGLWRQEGIVGAWSRLRDDDCLDVDLDPDDSSIIFLGVRDKGVYKSFTSGASWSSGPILPYVAENAGNRATIKIALGRRNADGTMQTRTTRTVVVRFGMEICVNQKSGEGGAAAWQRAVPPPIMVPDPNSPSAEKDRVPEMLNGGSENRSDTLRVPGLPIPDGEWCNCLAVDPFDSSHILVASEYLLERKGDEEIWSERRIPHEDVHGLAFDSETHDLVYIANDGGLFSSRDGGATWPTMSLADVTERPGRGINLARGLVTSEFRHSAVQGGCCVGTIDHTGYILSENFDDDESWQFLFNNGNGNGGFHGGHESSFVFPCPASPDRWYIFTARSKDDETKAGRHFAQLDFSRTNGFVNRPEPRFLSAKKTFVFSLIEDASFRRPTPGVEFFPEDQVYLRHLPGPLAARFINNERLLLFATDRQPGVGFTIQSLRLARDGATVIEEITEATHADEAFSAITFAPDSPDRAFAITLRGELFECDFSLSANIRQFVHVNQSIPSANRWNMPEESLFVSKLVAVTRPALNLYAISQRGIGRFDYRSEKWSTIYTEARPNETLLSFAAHPTRGQTVFLGTNRGVYLSEDGARTWQPYRQKLPRVPVTDLFFDQGYLYAATLGRGLWRCRPCSG